MTIETIQGILAKQSKKLDKTERVIYGVLAQLVRQMLSQLS